KPLLTENETLDVYQGEEHSNVTLTWSNPHHNATRYEILSLHLIGMEPLRPIYRYHSRYKPEPYIDEQFRGRLQCHLQLVRKGRIECVLTDLSLNDTGRYHWEVVDVEKRHRREYKLDVKPSMHQTQEETHTPIDRGRFGLYVGLGLFLVVTGGLSLRYTVGSVSSVESHRFTKTTIRSIPDMFF
ncbi:hypothetical protein CHARACLAT_022380, partial [Characodon lateralis]|nr:hypothetical protein [Characodon lateralis]